MNNLIRFYNQNRLQFWIIVIIIAAILILIHVLNGFVKEDNKKRASQSETNTINIQEIANTKKVSEPVIEGNTLNENQKNNNIEILDNFLSYCKNGNIEKAYNLLSSNCKELFYPSQEDFEEKYVKQYFSSNIQYDYELWDSSKYNIYRIKTFEDMLSTGKVSNDFSEDYYTIVSEKEGRKLNINSFINRETINKSISKNNVTVKINYVDVYQDNYIYNITINNKNNNTIVLDTRKNTNSTYVENGYGAQFAALLYENLDKDLIISPNVEKTIQIKFNISYRNNINIKSLVFSDVVLDINNTEQKTELKIEL